MRHLVLVLFIVSFVLLPTPVQAAIIISEVYPAPSSGENEWIELFNTSSENVTLSGWKLQDKLSSPSDIFSFTTQTIPAQSFLSLDLNTAKLNNSADGISLYTAQNGVVDTMDYTASETGKSWQRTSPSSTSFMLTTPSKGSDSAEFSFISSATSELTTPAASPNPESSPSTTPQPTTIPTVLPSPTPTATLTPSPTATPSPSPAASPTPTSSPTPTPAAFDPTVIQLSELMACPTSGSEWIELYNSSDQAITLQNWKITDESANYRTLIGSVAARSWQIFSWSGSLLNNSGDSVTLTTTTGQIISQLEYDSCTAGKSLVASSANGTTSWVPVQATPGARNATPQQAESTPATSTSATAVLLTPTAYSALQNSRDPLQLFTEAGSVLGTIAGTRSKPIHSQFMTPFLPDNLKADSQASYSARFYTSQSQGSRSAIVGGILSGLVSIISSLSLLYGKKITAFFAEYV